MSIFNFDELKKSLRESIVTVHFRKADGSLRRMKATLKSDLIPPNVNVQDSNSSTVTVWDTEKNGWRSFRKENVTGIEYEADIE